jgi:uncharacterized membrane protein YbhN (UPF0104 family)
LTEPPSARRAGAHLVTVAIGIVLAAVLLYYSLRGIDWRQVGAIVAHSDFRLLALCAATAVLTMFLRAWRWRILLNAEAHASLTATFWATAAGLFANNLLPARAGELVRTYMVASECRLPKTYVLATAIAERIADAIVLVLIGALTLLTMPSPPGWLAGAARPFAIVGLIGAAGIAVLPLLAPAGRRMIGMLPIPKGLRSKLIAALEEGLRGLRSFHDAGRLAAFVGLAVLIWVLDAAGSVVGGAALGLRLSLPMAFLLMAGLGLGSALPSTPGYVGIYQFVTVSILTPFGVSRADAIAFILVTQALMYVVIGVFGGIGLLRRRKLV